MDVPLRVEGVLRRGGRRGRGTRCGRDRRRTHQPLARALARAHGGDLVTEAAATGARFRLSLPVGER